MELIKKNASEVDIKSYLLFFCFFVFFCNLASKYGNEEIDRAGTENKKEINNGVFMSLPAGGFKARKIHECLLGDTQTGHNSPWSEERNIAALFKFYPPS